VSLADVTPLIYAYSCLNHEDTATLQSSYHKYDTTSVRVLYSFISGVQTGRCAAPMADTIRCPRRCSVKTASSRWHLVTFTFDCFTSRADLPVVSREVNILIKCEVISAAYSVHLHFAGYKICRPPDARSVCDS